MKKNQIRRALLMSALSLLLCVSMLVGTTFAWFTDSVTSGSNVITAGNLDIVLEYWDGDSWEDAENKVIPFVAADGRSQDQILWEPGCTYQMAPIRVRNEGNLNAKILILLNGVTGSEKLMEVIKLKTKVSNIPESLLNGSAGNVFKKFEGAELDIFYGMPEGNVVFDHSLAGKGQVTPGTGHTDTSPEFTLFGHMAEEAGNEYQNLTIEGISITVLATQQTYESDSFNNQYDKDATLPMIAYGTVDGNDEVISVGKATVTVPKEAGAGEYTLKIENENTATNENDETVVSFDLSLEKDGVPVAAQNGVAYDVKYFVGTELQIVDLLHKGEPVTNYEYNRTTGYLTFTVSDFSPFEIIYNQSTAGGYDIVRINTLDDFTAFGKAVNSNTTYNGVQVANNPRVWVEVMNDIDMTNAPAIQGTEFSIGNGNNLQFTGVFDGNYHTISNYHITASWTYNVSLFRTVSGSFTMCDITFENCSSEKPNNRESSLLVGTVGGGTITFKNVDVKNSTVNGVSGASGYVGKMTEGALYFIDCDVDNVTLTAKNATGKNGMFLAEGYSHHDYDESGVWVENCTITNSTSSVNSVQDEAIAQYHYTK